MTIRAILKEKYRNIEPDRISPAKPTHGPQTGHMIQDVKRGALKQSRIGKRHLSEIRNPATSHQVASLSLTWASHAPIDQVSGSKDLRPLLPRPTFGRSH